MDKPFDTTRFVNEISEIVELLVIIRSKLGPNTEFNYTSFRSGEEMASDIDDCIKMLQQGDKETLRYLNTEFATAMDYQDLAMQNGWSAEYHRLAKRFDKCYIKIKRTF